MVRYTTYTSIAFDVANSKGAQFSGIEDGGEFIAELGEYWNENPELKQMTEDQVRNQMNEVVSA